MKKLVFHIKLYAMAMTAYLVMEALWIGLVAQPFYNRRIGHLMSESPNIPAAIHVGRFLRPYEP